MFVILLTPLDLPVVTDNKNLLKQKGYVAGRKISFGFIVNLRKERNWLYAFG